MMVLKKRTGVTDKMLDGKKVEIKASEFDPIPMDKYTTQIVDVNLITQLKYQSTEEEEVLNYQFAILDDKPMETSSGEKASTRGRFLWKRCRLTFNKRSWLGKLAIAAIGRDLTKEEIADFDVESLVGKQVDVMVEQKESKDGTKIFNNVVTFNKTAKELEPMEEKDIAKTGKVVEKKTTSATAPATAPDADNEADELIDDLKKEGEEEESIEEMEAKLKKAKAKKKAALKKMKEKK